MPDESNPCLDDSTLADLKAGRLDRHRAAMAEGHVRSCPTCAARLRTPDLPAELLALRQYAEPPTQGGRIVARPG